jgi:hypothetical protein
MVIGSAASLLSFLLLVAPGIAYELTRQHRRPSRTDSAFIEASRILLAGMLVAVLCLALLAFVRLAGSGLLVDAHALLLHPGLYGATHPERLFVSVVAYLAVAVTLAVLIGDTHPHGSSTSRIVPDSAWFLTLDRYAPVGSTVHVAVTMLDGSAYMGVKSTFTSDPELQDRELVLRPPIHTRAHGSETTVPLDPSFHRLVLPGNRISSLAISYVATTDADTPSAPARSSKGALQWLSQKWLQWPWWKVAAAALAFELGLISALSALI